MIFLRSLLFNIFFYGLTAVLAVAALPLRLVAPGMLRGYARAWVRLVLGGLRLICGISYEVSGLHHLPAEGPALIAPMHQSAVDTLIWTAIAPRFAFVLKRELTRIPLFGPLLIATGMIAVDREGGAAAVRGLLRDADAAVALGRQIIIFPEGTRVAPGARGTLQPGIAALAARTRLPVIPVATDSGHRWGRVAFRKSPGTIHLLAMPPIPAGLPREALMQRIEAAFAEGAAQLATPVDNSVGGRLGSLPLRAS
jgi:1-acyl-sn-glycerol-3-phosphate acyltransferase